LSHDESATRNGGYSLSMTGGRSFESPRDEAMYQYRLEVRTALGSVPAAFSKYYDMEHLDLGTSHELG
jgi:hypothetical protein